MKAIDVVRRYLVAKDCALHKGNVYKKIPESTKTYSFLKNVEDFLNNALKNAEFADNIAAFKEKISKLLSAPSCRIIKNIKIDFNFIECQNGWFFNIEEKIFEQNPHLKGSPRAFVLYEYTGEVPYPKPFVEGM